MSTRASASSVAPSVGVTERCVCVHVLSGWLLVLPLLNCSRARGWAALPMPQILWGIPRGLESSDGKEKKAKNRPAGRGPPQRAPVEAWTWNLLFTVGCGCDAVTTVVASGLWLGRAGSGSLLASCWHRSGHVGSGWRPGLCQEWLAFCLWVGSLAVRAGERAGTGMWWAGSPQT